MLRNYKYRLYPNKKQTTAFDNMLYWHCKLYNAALEERINAYKRNGTSVTYYMQAMQLKEVRKIEPELEVLNFSSLQQTLRRLNKAYDAFFRRIKQKQKAGFPRFKSIKRFHSVTFTYNDGIRLIDNRLRITGIGNIKVKLHRAIPAEAKIKQAVIKRVNDKYYVVFAIEIPDNVKNHMNSNAVGIDIGINAFAVTSDGVFIENPKWLQKEQAKLRRQQRRVARRKKGSNRWRKAIKQVVKTHERIANQRKDYHHKISRMFAEKYSKIVIEDLNIKNMVRNGNLAKSISDAGWGQFINMIAYKVEETGSRLVKMPPKNTSQICSGCGVIVSKSLSVRVHNCPDCGLNIDRDLNAAINILKLHAPGLGAQALTQIKRSYVA